MRTHGILLWASMHWVGCAAVVTAPDAVSDDELVVCTAAANDPCVARCEDGHGASCIALSPVLEAACGPDDAGACHRLALLFENGEGIENGFEPANEAHDRACRFGHAGSCSRLAFLHAVGDGIELDFDRALVLGRMGCGAVSTMGCTGLGLVFDSRGVMKIDRPRAAAIYSRACDLGYGDACYALGVAYQVGAGVRASKKEARRLYRRACDMGDEVTCELFEYKFGDRRPPRSTARRETRRYAKLCSKGAPLACFRLGVVHLMDTSKSASLPVAAEFMGKACGLGVEAACERTEGLMRRRDELRAGGSAWRVVETDGRSCQASDELCLKHQLKIVGNEGRRPVTGALREETEEILYRASLFKRACERGDAGGCMRLGMMFGDGDALPQEPARAVEYLDRACDNGGCVAACGELRRQRDRQNSFDSTALDQRTRGRLVGEAD